MTRRRATCWLALGLVGAAVATAGAAWWHSAPVPAQPGLMRQSQLVPYSHPHIKMIELPDLQLELQAVDPLEVGFYTSDEIGELIEKAQVANASWLPFWGICDAFTVKYRLHAYEAPFAAGRGLPDPKELGVRGPAAPVYEGPYNRGCRLVDVAELIVYGCYFGARDAISLGEDDSAGHPGRVVLSGEFKGFLAYLLGRYMPMAGLSTPNPSQQRWYNAVPVLRREADRLSFELEFSREDGKLRSSHYVLRKGQLDLAEWLVRYGYGHPSESAYPTVVDIQAATFGEPGLTQRGELEISLVNQKTSKATINFAKHEGLWMATEIQVMSSYSLSPDPSERRRLVVVESIERIGEPKEGWFLNFIDQ